MEGVESAVSRRPPRETKGVNRPEGGARAAGGDAPAPVRQWPMLLVLGGVAAGLAVTRVSFRPGLLVVGFFLLLAGVLRGTVGNVGMLAVRSRFTDIVTYAVLGGGVTLSALTAMPDPILDLPWLQDLMSTAVR